MSQLPDLTPNEGEEVFACVTDNKHNKTQVSVLPQYSSLIIYSFSVICSCILVMITLVDACGVLVVPV